MRNANRPGARSGSRIKRRAWGSWFDVRHFRGKGTRRARCRRVRHTNSSTAVRALTVLPRRRQRDQNRRRTEWTRKFERPCRGRCCRSAGLGHLRSVGSSDGGCCVSRSAAWGWAGDCGNSQFCLAFWAVPRRPRGVVGNADRGLTAGTLKFDGHAEQTRNRGLYSSTPSYRTPRGSPIGTAQVTAGAHAAAHTSGNECQAWRMSRIRKALSKVAVPLGNNCWSSK